MYKSNCKRVIEIAQRFEDTLRVYGVKSGDEKISFSADDIYFLLCLVMPDPASIKWEKSEGSGAV